MKKGILLIAAFLVLLALQNLSCTKSSDTSGSDNPGEWLFWTDSTLYSPQITVYVSYGAGKTDIGTITEEYPEIPECGAPGCFTIDLTTLGISSNAQSGTFTYTAVDSLSPTEYRRWNGTIVVTSNNWQHCNSTNLN
jgi:hypothetical protein